MLLDTKIVSNGIKYSTLPKSYVRPALEQPKLSEVADWETVPMIDLGCEDESSIIQQIGDACRDYGLFQVTNHGVPEEIMEKMLKVADEFFHLPLEEKMKLYSEDPFKTVRLSTSSNVKKETVHNWRDYLRLHCYPLEKYASEWPSNPSTFKEIVSKYCTEIRNLGARLQQDISKSLGLEKDCIKNILGEQGQHMAINYYPPCPEPELTYGLPAHADPNALTILLQDTQVAGLQVLKDGKWLAVKPLQNALIINIGDQLQALSNGKYTSVWHRAVVNADKARISVASFLCPSNDAVISAPKELTIDGSPAIYRDYTYAEYYKKFWGRNLDQEHCLELFKN
ncbi:protein DOWNY MILDEW RESISTANCE 6-like [Olea europaea var. sylvestris]|uniref:DOWNY MILDEW RESISTANCE 6-like n=1 Tax=Olea europaea subsp. europaea TaxID=158383 RepID=A0A8S0S4V9_OLEEU|nr:protein DOWNY MILDEW RESISTANCE 6-like [Olea europaea var. sylvestris]CAA2986383.1 DOWNY MILDEW RESISTANCE 6-like [Olea europaea subsp. europaea]